VIGVVVGVLALVGVVAFFLLRDDDDGEAFGPRTATEDTAEPDEEPDEEPDGVPVPGDVTLPDISIPELPDVTMPDVTDFTMPSLPDLSIPDIQIPRSPGTFAPRGEIPEPTEFPEGLGDDPMLDELAVACFEGSMQACDDLYDESVPGSEYERYGDTCAGRQPEGTQQYCVASFPE